MVFPRVSYYQWLVDYWFGIAGSPMVAAEDPGRSHWSNLMLRFGWSQEATEADPYAPGRCAGLGGA